MRQSFYFLTETSVRLEFNLRVVEGGIEMETLHNPPREPDTITLASADEVADAMAARVKFHLDESGAVLRLIRVRHDLAPLTSEHLGRFAVPLIPAE